MSPDLAPLVEALRTELERQGLTLATSLDPDWTVLVQGDGMVSVNLAPLVEAVLAAQWRPIETAPKDGTPILIARAGGRGSRRR